MNFDFVFLRHLLCINVVRNWYSMVGASDGSAQSLDIRRSDEKKKKKNPRLVCGFQRFILSLASIAHSFLPDVVASLSLIQQRRAEPSNTRLEKENYETTLKNNVVCDGTLMHGNGTR